MCFLTFFGTYATGAGIQSVPYIKHYDYNL